MKNITIYTDGSWKKTTQSGGWACLLVCWPYWKILSGREVDTTNNRMELLAILNGLKSLNEACRVTIISDSAYAVNCINKWIYGWSMNGWRNSFGEPVINKDILVRIHEEMCKHSITAQWIKAHTHRDGVNYRGNACVDLFAQMCSLGEVSML